MGLSQSPLVAFAFSASVFALPCHTLHGRASMGQADGYLAICPTRVNFGSDLCVRVLDDRSYKLLLPLLGEPLGSKVVFGDFTICPTGVHGPGSAENVTVPRIEHWRTKRVR